MAAGMASEGNTVTRVSVGAFLAALRRAASVDEAMAARRRERWLIENIGRNLDHMASESTRAAGVAAQSGSEEDKAYLAMLGSMMERTQAAYAAATDRLQALGDGPES